MVKRILIALAFATAGVLCGTGGPNVGATNFVILGGGVPTQM
jgi:hypothetical protein